MVPVAVIHSGITMAPHNGHLIKTSTAKMFILVTHLHAKICLIGNEEFGFWYNFVLILLCTDIIATNVAETVRRNFARSFNNHIY